MAGSYEVDTQFLQSIVAPLRQAVRVAREVHARSGQLPAGMGNCGSDRLAGTARQMLDRWGYGMGLVADDGEHVATGLERAAAAYAESEWSVADAASELGDCLPDSGREQG